MKWRPKITAPAKPRRITPEWLGAYGSCASAVIAAVGLLFIWLQVRGLEDQVTDAEVQTVKSQWLEWDKALLDSPELRIYFDEGAKIERNNPKYDDAVALALLKLDIVDFYADPKDIPSGNPLDLEAWHETFVEALSNSPLMCERLAKAPATYGCAVVALGATWCEDGKLIEVRKDCGQLLQSERARKEDRSKRRQVAAPP